MRGLAAFCFVLLFVAFNHGCKEEAAKGEAEKEQQVEQKKETDPASAAQATAIVARALEAMGGREQMKEKCTSYAMKTKGVFFGMPYVMTTWWKYPDKMIMAMDDGSMTMGYVGDQCWNKLNTIVKDCMPDEMKSYPETLWSFRVMSLFPILDEGYDVAYDGEAEVNGKAVDKVTVSAEDAPMPITIAFEKETGLPLQMTYEGNFGGKKGAIAIDVLGYRDVDGMKIMSESTMTMDGKSLMRDEYVSVDWNDVPDETFARPPQAGLGVAAVRSEHPVTVAAAMHKGPYESLGATIGKTYGSLGMNGIAPWGPPTMEFINDPMNAAGPEEYLTRITVPVMKPEGELPKLDGVWFDDLPEREIAVRVEQGKPEAVAQAFPELVKWIAEQGLVVAGRPSMTTFDNPMTTPPDKLLHELFIQVGHPAKDPARATAAGEAAKGLFAACASQDWDGAATWYKEPSESFKKRYGGMEVVTIGTPFCKFQDYPGLHVPYTIKLADGEVKEWYLAVRDDNPEKKWQFDGGM